MPDPTHMPYVPNATSSTYIPMDSWMYPALDRLSSLGYIDSAFFGLRPWTRLSVANMLAETGPKLMGSDDDRPGHEEAQDIYLKLVRELAPDTSQPVVHAEVDRAYVRGMQIAGPTLTDSYNFGQTIINDYGRPFAQGFNMVAGGRVRGEAGRFSLAFRAEYQHANGLAAYSQTLQQEISANTYQIPLPTSVAVPTRNQFRVLEANASFHVWGHEISGGKSEMWWGPAQGGAMLYSTNSEPLYMFRINRVEPLRIPLISRLLGPIRYDNFFGDFKGHYAPNKPFIIGNKIEFHPTRNFEMGFGRTVVFAGEGIHGLTFSSVYHALFNGSSPPNSGETAHDVGDRRSNFSFRWRLPYLRDRVTIYSDSVAEDDLMPFSNFRRSGWRPGIYLPRLPKLSKMDFRFESAYTNAQHYDQFTYANHTYTDGYQNKGFLAGDWIGRSSNAYQGWLTWWLSPQEMVQFQYRNSKISNILWHGGGSQTDIGGQLIKRLSPDLELNAQVQWERWTIPELSPGLKHNMMGSFQLTWYPGRSYSLPKH